MGARRRRERDEDSGSVRRREQPLEGPVDLVGIVATMLVGTPSALVPPALPPRRSRRAAGAVVVALVMVLVTGGAAWMSHDSGPHFPDHWDPRVADLARFVERTRGLRYDHPVRVYFLSAAEYRRAILGPDIHPTATDRADSRRRVGLLRALGVVDGDPDLLNDENTLADAGSLAFYDFRTKVVNVRGHWRWTGVGRSAVVVAATAA